MKTKNMVIVAVLATLMFSGIFLSTAAAREQDNSSSDIADGGLIAPAPDDNQGLIAPGPEDNSTNNEGQYNVLDDRAAANDTSVPSSEGDQPNLIATNTGVDNTVLFALIGAACIAIIAGAVGVVYYRRKATKA